MLKHKFMSSALLLALVVSPAICLAQDMPHGKWWQSPRAVKQLDLTDEERGKLDEKFVESRRRLIDLKSNVEKERFEVDNLLDSEVLKEDAVRAQFKKLEEARGALSAERFNFLLEVRQILGFERFQKIKALSELRRHKKGRKGDRAGLKREDSREMALGGLPRHWGPGPKEMPGM